MLEFKLPKKPIDKAIVLNTPAGADAAMGTGLLIVLDEAGTEALKVKVSDITGWKKQAYSAGVAHVVNVALASAVISANNIYSLSVEIPNIVNPETKGIHKTVTYTVSVDGTPTVAELQALFVAKINSQTAVNGLTATSQSGTVVRITGTVPMGQLRVTTSIQGATVANQTAYVAPVGTPDEVGSYLLPSSNISVTGNEYTRYLLAYREYSRHNAINGAQVAYPKEVFVYAEENGADFSDFTDALDAILDGTATAADYLGAPAL